MGAERREGLLGGFGRFVGFIVKVNQFDESDRRVIALTSIELEDACVSSGALSENGSVLVEHFASDVFVLEKRQRLTEKVQVFLLVFFVWKLGRERRAKGSFSERDHFFGFAAKFFGASFGVFMGRSS